MRDVTPLDRRRAEHALQAVTDLTGQGALASGYKSYVKGAPAMILTLGIGQALATFLARAGNEQDKGQGGTPDAYRKLFDHATDWLFSQEDPTGLYGSKEAITDRGARIKAILALGQRDYLILQSEALAYLEWLKKFANALLVEQAETQEEPLVAAKGVAG